MQIVHKVLGPIDVDVAIENGALVAKIGLPVIALVDKAADAIKGKIPGIYDDAVIDVIVSALKAELMK